MKRLEGILIFPIIIISLFFVFCYPKAVTEEEALTAVLTYIKAQESSWKMEPLLAPEPFSVGEEYSILQMSPIRTDGTTLAYVAELEPEGYIVMSPDTCIYPVVLYSFSGSFPFEDTPENVVLHLITWDMQNRIRALPAVSDEAKNTNIALWSEYVQGEKPLIGQLATTTQWGPWLETTWDQESPYNKYCPCIHSLFGVCITRGVVGCTATAMAQIIHYWRYPESVEFDADDKYETKTEKIKIDDDHEENDFPSFAELKPLLSNIEYDGNENEIAALCFACGISIQMDYKTEYFFFGVSGAYASAAAYTTKFGYTSADEKDGDDGDFFDSLEQNMKDHQPCQLAIYKCNKAQCADNELEDGHSIVADGYKDTGEFHLNFGWSGSTDGWYHPPPQDTPAGYNVFHSAVINIKPPVAPRPLKYAVTDPGWDDIGSILGSMGYQYDEIHGSQLADYDFIKDYKAIFINCSWDCAANAPIASASLEQYVRDGGALYASDFAFAYLQESFPGYLNYPDPPYIGIGDQHVAATITDPGLEAYLGESSVDIYYNLGGWVPLTGVGPDTDVLMSGDIEAQLENAMSTMQRVSGSGGKSAVSPHMKGNLAPFNTTIWTDKPLAASFRYGKGFVIYTSFHNEPQLTELHQRLLEYFILKPITADIAGFLINLLEEMGVETTDEVIDVIDEGMNKAFFYVVGEVKRILIALGFGGSLMRLSVYRPDGSLYDEAYGSTSPIVVEIPAAEPGAWTYEVTALDLPPDNYHNYPFVVEIGEAPVNEEPTEACCDLVTDWNLVSPPLDPADAVPSLVFDEVGDPLYLCGYNTAEGDFNWADDRPPSATTGTEGTLTEVSPLGGYWLAIQNTGLVPEFCAVGTPLTGDQMINMPTAGWYLIGVPYNVAWGNVTNVGSIKLTHAGEDEWLPNAATRDWIFGTVLRWNEANWDRIRTTTGVILVPCLGYWIRTRVDNLVMTFTETEWDPGNPPPFDVTAIKSEDPGNPPMPGIMRPVSFSAHELEFTNYPNPVRDVHTTTFAVKGVMAPFVESIKVEIYDLSDRLVFANEKAGTSVDWDTTNDYGEYLANGVYLYKLYALVDGHWVSSEVKRLAILR